MPTQYFVSDGDCISSIAFENGFLPDTIWFAPENQQLRELRKNANILRPGDVVHIPDIQIKTVSAASDDKHQFKLKNVPAYLPIKVLFAGEALRNKPYSLDLDGVLIDGTTDGEGQLQVPVSPSAMKGFLRITANELNLEFQLSLGMLNPISETVGVKQRLVNLGYAISMIDDQIDEDLVNAIRLFESDNKIELTGQLSDTVREKLTNVHGS